MARPQKKTKDIYKEVSSLDELVRNMKIKEITKGHIKERENEMKENEEIKEALNNINEVLQELRPKNKKWYNKLKEKWLGFVFAIILLLIGFFIIDPIEDTRDLSNENARRVERVETKTHSLATKEQLQKAKTEFAKELGDIKVELSILNNNLENFIEQIEDNK
jgi:hypothetical protein